MGQALPKTSIPQEFIERITDSVDLASLIGIRVNLKPSGADFKGLCPFHQEKTASFYVMPQKGFYHCFGCGAHGDAIDFLRESDGLSFVEAVTQIAEHLGLEVPREKMSEEQKQQQVKRLGVLAALGKASEMFGAALHSDEGGHALKYVAETRGLKPETIKAFALGFCPGHLARTLSGRQDELSQDISRAMLSTGNWKKRDEGGGLIDLMGSRLVFPLRRRNGDVVGFAGRDLSGNSNAKYINSPVSEFFDKQSMFYGEFENRAEIGKAGYLMVVEGYVDVIGLWQVQIRNAVAVMGVGSRPETLSRMFSLSPHLVFCFDGDRAGRDAAFRVAENAVKVIRDGQTCRFVFLPEGEDPDSLAKRSGREAFLRQVEAGEDLTAYLLRRFSEDIDLSMPEGKGVLNARCQPILQGFSREARGIREGFYQMKRQAMGYKQIKPRFAPIMTTGPKNALISLAILMEPSLSSDWLPFLEEMTGLEDCAQFATWMSLNGVSTTQDAISRLTTNEEERAIFFNLFDSMQGIKDMDAAAASGQELMRRMIDERERQRRLDEMFGPEENESPPAEATPPESSHMMNDTPEDDGEVKGRFILGAKKKGPSRSLG